MRCQCCDHILTDFEATRKFKESQEYADMCNRCVKELPPEIEFVGRSDLDTEQGPDDFDIDEELKNLDDLS